VVNVFLGELFNDWFVYVVFVIIPFYLIVCIARRWEDRLTKYFVKIKYDRAILARKRGWFRNSFDLFL